MSEIFHFIRDANGILSGRTLISLEHIVTAHLSHQAELMDTLLATIGDERITAFQNLLIGGCFVELL
jgi:hypothetical protein